MPSAFVQKVGADKKNAASPVVTIGATVPTVGNHLIAMLVTGGTQLTALSVTDGAGNTWQNDSGLTLFESVNNRGIVFLSCKVANAYTTGQTITFAPTGGTNYSVTVIEVSGLDATTWFSARSAMATGTSTAPASATVSCAAGDFGAGIIIYKLTPPAAAPGAGWTEATDDNIGTIASSAYEANYQANLSAGTTADSATIASAAWDAVTAVYKAAAGGAAPANTVAPAVTGTTVVGSALSCSQGTWTNSPTSYAYQWQRDNAGGGTYSNISSATSSSYTLVDADDGCNIRCVVTATNGSGSTPANSNAVGLITEPAPTNSVAPVASGTAQVGSTVSTTTGTWNNMGGVTHTYAYQWQRDNQGGGIYSNIVAATSSSYVLADADDACHVRCVVTATNSGGSTPANSNALGLVVEPAPTLSTAPVASGTAQVGATVSTTNGVFANMGGFGATYTYQWQTSPDGSTGWANISLATGQTYTPVTGDLGNYLRCVVTAHNDTGTASGNSNALGPVAASSPVVPVTPPIPTPSSPFGDTAKPMLWRWVVGDLPGRGLAVISRARKKKITVMLNAPVQAEGYAMSDDESIATVHSDGYPYLDPLDRTLKCFRREPQSDGSFAWRIRMAGYVYDVDDEGDETSVESYFLAYSPLQRLARRKCRDSSGLDVLINDSGDAGQLLKTQIDRTNTFKGETGIDTGGQWDPISAQTVRWERKWIAEAATDLTGAYNGFDLIETPLDRTTGKLSLLGATPRRGAQRTSMKLGYFAPPHNISKIKLESHGTDLANDIEGVGQTRSGSSSLVSPQSDAGSVSRYGTYEDVFDVSDVADQTGLDQQTIAQLQIAKGIIPVLTITLAPGAAPPPWVDQDGNSSWDIGDVIPAISFGPGFRFSGFSGHPFRIQGFELDIDEEGVETVGTLYVAPANL